MNSNLIVIDGKTYHSVNEMPPDVREKYEQAMRPFGDEDKNGIPDILENSAGGSAVMNSMRIIVDGKEFDGIENLPPEARARYEEAMGKLDANRNGIPDFVEGMTNATKQTTTISTDFGLGTQATPPYLPVSSSTTPDTSNGWMLALAGLFVILLCAAGAAGVWYFFLR